MLTESLHAAASLLRKARYVVALTGAGISTRSGIPDCRSPHSGLWETVNPAEVASLVGFRHHPERFYAWIGPLARAILDAQPNAAHRALVQMEQNGRLRTIITQNIDMLHTRAGSQAVVEIHGHLREATCIHCFQVYQTEPLIEVFASSQAIPRCSACGHVLKPNVILFGEQLPAQALSAARREARRCDTMLVVGTSLEVYPAADLPVLAQQTGAAVILVNLEHTPFDTAAQVVIRADAADVLPGLVTVLESE